MVPHFRGGRDIYFGGVLTRKEGLAALSTFTRAPSQGVRPVSSWCVGGDTTQVVHVVIDSVVGV